MAKEKSLDELYLKALGRSPAKKRGSSSARKLQKQHLTLGYTPSFSIGKMTITVPGKPKIVKIPTEKKYKADIRLHKSGYIPDLYIKFGKKYQGPLYDSPKVQRQVMDFLKKKGYTGPGFGRAELGMQGDTFIVYEPVKPFYKFAQSKGFELLDPEPRRRRKKPEPLPPPKRSWFPWRRKAKA